MRASSSKGRVKALAIAGTRVVALGWNMAQADIKSKDVLGFGIERTRKRDGEVIWMRGTKTFKSVLGDPGAGVQVSTREHPFQSFQWSDYSVEPGQAYTYRIVAMTGVPGDLKQGPAARLEVRTESDDIGKHSVYFNRGAIASQEYARRFKNQSPEVVGQAAWDWLSRGLIEALERFIGQAQEGDEIHGAIFELKHKRVFDALKSAKKRKAKIFIVYDGQSQGAARAQAVRTIRAQQVLCPVAQRNAEAGLDRFHQPERQRDLRAFEQWPCRP
jgi:hypothetical protein